MCDGKNDKFTIGLQIKYGFVYECKIVKNSQYFSLRMIQFYVHIWISKKKIGIEPIRNKLIRDG